MDRAVGTQRQPKEEVDQQLCDHEEEERNDVRHGIGHQGAEAGLLVIFLGQGQQHAEVGVRLVTASPMR